MLCGPSGRLGASMPGRFGSLPPGYPPAMTDDRTDQRAADLLPEERGAGSSDPRAQAEAILAESDEREDDLTAAPSSFLEHRTSAQTIMPGEGTQ